MSNTRVANKPGKKKPTGNKPAKTGKAAKKPAPPDAGKQATAKPSPPAKPRGRKRGDVRRLEAHKGAVEKHLLRARRAFDMRCDGATIRQIAAALRCAPSTVHDDIEEFRAKLRRENMDLAAQEREISLQQLDLAIASVIPHIRGDVDIETVKEGKRGPITITVETYEARMKGCGALARLIERKARLLGMEAPIKIEGDGVPAAPPEQTLEKGRDVLKRWGVSFAPRGVTGEKVDE